MGDTSSNDQKRRPRSLLYYYGIVFLVVVLFNLIVMPLISARQIVTTTYSDFIRSVNAGEVTQVLFSDTEIQYVKEAEGGYVSYFKTGVVDNPELPKILQEKGIAYAARIPETPNLLLTLLLRYGLPILIFSMIGKQIRKTMTGRLGAGGLSIYGQGVAKVYKPDEEKKTFADVAGQEEAKESLQEIIDYLNNPQKYEDVGARCPKGVLLVGPPGTGKTLMAKAVAGEADVPFFSISGSEFVEMFVGRGAAKVRELFDQAGKHAPCIVFIDEIDTIGKRRDSQFSTNDEREQTLNQLLTEMDGFEGNKGVIILAATNRPDVLDPALLRPGRFDRRIPLELPDLIGREAILKVHLNRIKTQDDLDINLIARMTAGASGAQLANIVNEAALRAVRLGNEHVSTKDLTESVEVIIAGAERKNAILSEEEKRIVAYHEIGHALVAARQKGSAPVQKITIVPRTSGALGYTMQVEEDEKSLHSKEDAYQKLEVLCGGRAAEEIVFNIATTGASNDIERATEIARNMVTRYGMSKTFGMMALQTGGNAYMGESGRMNCSPETARMVDEEVRNIIAEAHRRATDILVNNREKMDELAEYLIEKETISGQEFMDILLRKTA